MSSLTSRAIDLLKLSFGPTEINRTQYMAQFPSSPLGQLAIDVRIDKHTPIFMSAKYRDQIPPAIQFEYYAAYRGRTNTGLPHLQKGHEVIKLLLTPDTIEEFAKVINQLVEATK